MMTLLTRNAKSAHLLPLFTGLWYNAQSGYDYQGYDACSVVRYTYNELTSSPQELLSIPTNYSFCTWDYDNINYYGNSTSMPGGFISNNYDDWEKILLDPNAAIKVTYGITCEDSGGAVWEYNKVTAAPFYECPPNTRISWDNTTKEVGCTTTPTSCYADIVARDLNYSVIEFFGHVGLVTTSKISNPYVIQVLDNDDPGIYSTPLYGVGAFSDIGKYWGERYGVAQLFITWLSSTISIDIINEAFDQKYYSFTYTVGYDYYPGVTQEHPYDCKFRCDSYIYHCYDAAGLKLQDSFNAFTVPFVIFDDFMCTANPMESCLIPGNFRKNSSMLLNKKGNFIPPFLVKNRSIEKSGVSATVIFSQLRSALLTKEIQQKRIPVLVNKYQNIKNRNLTELFARCLCFELKKIKPNQIDATIKPLLSEFLLKYRSLADDNFALAMMENRLDFYLKNPSCQWLSAFSAVTTESQADKEEAMITYIDQQDVVDQANLLSASRLTFFNFLSQKKKCEYGKLFQYEYLNNRFLSEREKNLLWLGLAEVKYPADKAIRPHSLCIT